MTASTDSEIPHQFDDTTLDTIAEHIFREADGDRLRAFELAREYTYPDYGPIHNKVVQKFVAIEEAAAQRIYAEAAGDRDRAFKLAREFTGLRHKYEIDNILRRKFQAADDEAADALAERCYREAHGDHRLGYQLARSYTDAGEDASFEKRHFAGSVSNRVKAKFVADTITDIGDNHPCVGQRKIFRWIRGENNQTLYSVGIEADGSLINPSNYRKDQLRTALRRTIAEEIETRREANVRAVETRMRRRSKLIHEIANGIRGGKKFGPRSKCLLCKKRLTDPTSIDRGIGPECWGDVLNMIERAKDREGQPGLQHHGLSVGAPERE